MVRHRVHFVFALGKFNDGVKWASDLNEACRKVGCAEGRLWTVGFGKVNECVMEYDYPDHAALYADQAKFQSSAETMSVFRRGAETRAPEHWPWDELMEEAPTLA